MRIFELLAALKKFDTLNGFTFDCLKPTEICNLSEFTRQLTPSDPLRELNPKELFDLCMLLLQDESIGGSLTRDIFEELRLALFGEFDFTWQPTRHPGCCGTTYHYPGKIDKNHLSAYKTGLGALFKAGMLTEERIKELFATENPPEVLKQIGSLINYPDVITRDTIQHCIQGNGIPQIYRLLKDYHLYSPQTCALAPTLVPYYKDLEALLRRLKQHGCELDNMLPILQTPQIIKPFGQCISKWWEQSPTIAWYQTQRLLQITIEDALKLAQTGKITPRFAKIESALDFSWKYVTHTRKSRDQLVRDSYYKYNPREDDRASQDRALARLAASYHQPYSSDWWNNKTWTFRMATADNLKRLLDIADRLDYVSPAHMTTLHVSLKTMLTRYQDQDDREREADRIFQAFIAGIKQMVPFVPQSRQPGLFDKKGEPTPSVVAKPQPPTASGRLSPV